MKLEWDEVTRFCVEAVMDKQALDVVVLKVGDLTDIADYFVITSGRTDRQIEAIVEAVEEKMSECGIKALGIEGNRRGGWILLDYGGLVVHVFAPETRDYYRLESLWISAPLYTGEEYLEIRARGKSKEKGRKI